MSNTAHPKHCNTPIIAEYCAQCPTCDHVLVIVKVPKEQVWRLNTEDLIGVIKDMPKNATAILMFEVLSIDPREFWQIDEIRRYVQKALAKCPQILSRFTPDDRIMMRNCVCEIAHTDYPNGIAQPVLLESSEWAEIARAAGVDPKE
jgi:hypothetical protein